MPRYDSDYDIPESDDELQPIVVKAKPSPPPLPFIPRRPPSPIRLSPQSKRDHRRQRRRVTKPVLGDGVLLSYMNPNYPDVSRRATEIALNSASHSEVSDSEMDEDKPPKPKRKSKSKQTTPEPTATIDLARKAMAATQALQAQASTESSNEDASLSPNPEAQQSQLSPQVSLNATVAGLQISAMEPDGSEVPRPGTSGSIMMMDAPTPNGYPAEAESLATSPNIGQHTIPDSEGPVTEKLAAMQSSGSPPTDGGPGSPTQLRNLPAFSELKQLAEAAAVDQDNRLIGFPHRQSISSMNGQPLPILTQVSPISANGEPSPSDPWKAFTSPNMPPTPKYDRRLSEAVLSPYGAANGPTPESAESIPSSHVSPADPAHAHRLSIDPKTRVLPLPVSTLGAAGVVHSATGTGSYKCDFPGCNAPPFQTQYLLNSHANVHSQNRPHYCPVRGCPRGEGGKGFKRKNEMIRHGLVHESPGYVCPFCPEREHKYPRPDNLQRHVRVHHIDKDKDDPLLRDVLAQRPEGPSRGRRRRVGS